MNYADVLTKRLTIDIFKQALTTSGVREVADEKS